MGIESGEKKREREERRCWKEEDEEKDWRAAATANVAGRESTRAQ